MGSTDNIVIKVFFADGSYKSMRVGEDDSTKQVCATILQKVTLTKTNGLLLYTSYKENNGINCQEIPENENPGVIYKKWENDNQLDKFKLVFKKKKDSVKWGEGGDALPTTTTSCSSPPTNSTKPSRPAPIPQKTVSVQSGPPSHPPPNPNQDDQNNNNDDYNNNNGIESTSPPSRTGPRPGLMGANPLMHEISLKRNNPDNKPILKSIPKKEQSQTVIIDWINKKLEEFGKQDKIENLEADLKNGCILALLLEGLSGLSIKDFNRNPNTKIHIIENNNIILRFLKVLGVNLVNISGEDMWETRPETMMRMLGIIIKHFHDSNPEKTKQRISMMMQPNQQQQQQTQQVQNGQHIRKPPPLTQRKVAAKPPPSNVNNNQQDDSNLPPPPTSPPQLKSTPSNNIVNQPQPMVAKRKPPPKVDSSNLPPPPPQSILSNSGNGLPPPPSLGAPLKKAPPAFVPKPPPKILTSSNETLPPPPTNTTTIKPPPPSRSPITNPVQKSPARGPLPTTTTTNKPTLPPGRPVASNENSGNSLQPPPPPLAKRVVKSPAANGNNLGVAQPSQIPLQRTNSEPPPVSPEILQMASTGSPLPPSKKPAPPPRNYNKQSATPFNGNTTSPSGSLLPPPPSQEIPPPIDIAVLPPPPSFNTSNTSSPSGSFKNRTVSLPAAPIIEIEQYTQVEEEQEEEQQVFLPPTPPLPHTLPNITATTTTTSTSPPLKFVPPPPPRSNKPIPPSRPPVFVEEPVVQEPEEVVEEIVEEEQQQYYEEETVAVEEEQQQYEEEQQYYEEEPIQEETSAAPVEINVGSGDEDSFTFEELESIMNANNFNFDDLLKEADQSIKQNASTNYDMGIESLDSLTSSGANNHGSSNTFGGGSDDLEDLLDRLARGEF